MQTTDDFSCEACRRPRSTDRIRVQRLPSPLQIWLAIGAGVVFPLVLLCSLLIGGCATGEEPPDDLPTCAEAGCPDGAFCPEDGEICSCFPPDGHAPVACLKER